MNDDSIRHAILQLLIESKGRDGQGLKSRETIESELEKRLGERVEPNDVRYNLEVLNREGLIKGFETQQRGIVHAVITSYGESVARNDYQPPQPAVQYNNTINVPGGYIGSVNIQGTIEELRVNIGSMRDKGMEDLSKSLERMIAATEASTQLEPGDQQATLDNLAILTEELVKPEPKRRLGAIRVIILGTIPMLIGHVADLIGLWESDLAQQLLATFGLL